MPFEFHKVITKKQIDAFHSLPFRLYADNACWRPPFRFEIEQIFDPNANTKFKEGECERFLVSSDEKIVARFALMTDPPKDEKYEGKPGGIGFLEFENDSQLVDCIFDFAKQWMQERNYTCFRGPINFGENDMYWGLLIENFINPPVYGLQYHLPYYKEQLERAGGEKTDDLICFERAYSPVYPDGMIRIAKRLEQNPRVKVRPLDKNNLKQDALFIKEIYNQAWGNQEIQERSSEFTPLTEEAVQILVQKLKPILIPEVCPIVFYDNEPASFLITLPDLNELSEQTSGLLKWWHYPKLFMFKKKVKRLRSLAIGTVPKFRRLGLEALIFVKGIEWGNRKYPNIKEFEGGWISEKNWLMQRSVEALGCTPYKRYRVYKWKV